MLERHNCETHYYSIDEILTSQEKVPCVFLKNIQLDCLGTTTFDSEGIQKNTIAEIPFWMAEELGRQEYSVVKVEVPKIYKDVYRDVLNADAPVVDLYKMSKFFYAFGNLVSNIDREQSAQLSSLLIQTFKERFRQLLDWVQNMSCDEVVTEKLDSLERELLASSRIAHNKLLCWLSNGIGSVQPAEIIINHKKRKLAAREIL